MSLSDHHFHAEVLDPFWKEWQQIVIHRSLPHQWEQCETTGRLENFRRAARGETGAFDGYRFNDSDLYKWTEAASYALALDPDSPTRSQVSDAISLIKGAQDTDGYLNTYYQIGEKGPRWSNLCDDHEMYCLGHAIEAGVAHHEATGSLELIHLTRKMAECIANRFGPEKILGSCGHQEIELALCRLSDALGEPQWRDLARWMIVSRGHRPSPFENELFVDGTRREGVALRNHFLVKNGEYDGKYLQDDKPLEEQDEPVGHAVRAMYFYCGAHDVFEGAVPEKMANALKGIWNRLVERRMYVTGGIGSSGENEGFTKDFDLPNRNAYAETCAGIGLVFWAHRMAALTGSAAPYDVLERVLYNAVLSGIGITGDKYFYDNPLESWGDHHRQPWFGCACCPPNVARLILSIGKYVGRANKNGIDIGLLFSSRISSGGLTVEVATSLPWFGGGEIRITEASGENKLIRVRAPKWSPNASITHRRVTYSADKSGWISINDEWKAGDTLTLNFEMPVLPVFANTEVADSRGKVATLRGPLIYCLEEADLKMPTGCFSLDRYGFEKEMKGLGPAKYGVSAYGLVDQPIKTPESYERKAPSRVETVLAPYFAWDNRQPGSMQVWLRTHK